MDALSEVDLLRRRLGPPESDHPLLQELDRDLDRGAGVDDPALGALLRRITRDYIPGRLNRMLRHRRDNPDAEVAGVNLSSYVIHQGRGCAINLSFVTGRNPTLNWHPFDAIFLRANPGTSRVHRYRLPASLENAVVDRQARLTFVGIEPFDEGDLLIKRGDLDVLDFEGAPGDPLLVVRLELHARGTLGWLFDRDTLTAIGGTATSPLESRLISLIRVAAQYPETDLAPLRAAARHPSHNVRWAAVQAIGKLDAQAAIALLSGMTGDPHPHIRNAAQKTLARLDR
jgi:hypothetical protein